MLLSFYYNNKIELILILIGNIKINYIKITHSGLTSRTISNYLIFEH